MKNLLEENSLFYDDYIGVDEAGRGSLAGPVVAAAVYIKKSDIGKIPDINDSKQLSIKKRRNLYSQIIRTHRYSIGIVSNKEIDKTNILKASLFAMKKAVEKIEARAEIILVDGIFTIPEISEFQESRTKGDQRFYSIAAASIVAKETRDRIMTVYSKSFPNYNFSKHKGYGTMEHKKEIANFGITKIHRKSFKLD